VPGTGIWVNAFAGISIMVFNQSHPCLILSLAISVGIGAMSTGGGLEATARDEETASSA